MLLKGAVKLDMEYGKPNIFLFLLPRNLTSLKKKEDSCEGSLKVNK